MRQYSLVCDEQKAEQIEGLAVKWGLTEQEVLDQLIAVGLEELD